ncbi:MAG: Uma2 family endonuclease [Pyrinomonadaceae bacterium MAG19_C2-C3]|nr:Uma2 family endonuclease [Pyrinomonadaceae bacterium MAG19_C2-C3]
MALPHIFYTIDEYLETERAGDERHEYIDGQLFLMSGESLAHSQICINIAGEVRAQLKGTSCQALSPNMKVRTLVVRTRRGWFSYPDLTVVCGTPQFHDVKKDVLTNPVALFEVLSPSTEQYDRGDKFLRFRTEIETLTDFVLIAQDKPLVEHFTRRPDGWLLISYTNLDDTLHLPNLNCRLSLAEVYDRVEFPSVVDDGMSEDIEHPES